MIKSIILSTLRNIRRHRMFSLINISGMIISMSLGLLIIIVVSDQYSYDSFHQDTERIYRINSDILRVDGNSEKYASTPLLLAEKLANEYSYFDNVVSLSGGLNATVKLNGEELDISGFYTSPEFFDVFNFSFSNSISNPLQSPYSIVITQESSKKFFGDKNAIGQVLKIEGIGEFTVTGILAKTPGSTHLEFEALASASTISSLRQNGILRPSTFDWRNYYFTYTYVKTKPGVSVSEIESALDAVSGEVYKGAVLEVRDSKIAFYAQALKDISPGPILSNNLGSGLPEVLLFFLIGLAAIVIIMACLNYTQLTIAKSISRAREIGVRKAIGAAQWQVFAQFVGEAIIISLVSLIFSYLLLQLIKPAFQSLHISQEFSMQLNETPTILLLFAAFAVFTGLIAGIIPAVYLSRLQPVKVLKSGTKLNINSKLNMRRVMLTFQFIFAIIFILTVLIINKQTQFMLNADYGFNSKQIINVDLKGVDYSKFAAEVSRFGWTENVSGVSHRLGTWEDRSSDYKKTLDGEAFEMRDFLVSDKYLQSLEVPLVAGRYFDESMISEGGEKFVIINQKGVEFLGYGQALEALGNSIVVNDSVTLEIIGVLRDFNFRPLNTAIGPVAFRLRADRASIMSIKINKQTQVSDIIPDLTFAWEKFSPRELELISMEDDIRKAYEDAGMTDLSKVIGYVSFLAITISCLGLLGMVMFIVQLRAKEVGMRKILGASIRQLVFTLSKSSLIMLTIALVVATPLSILLGDLFLSIYAFKISINPELILFGIAIVLALVLLTIGSQTLPTAKQSPLKWIRYE